MAYVFVCRTRKAGNGSHTCICGNMRLCESRMQHKLPQMVQVRRAFPLAARAPLSCHWHLCPKRKTRPRPERHNTVAATPLARVFASKRFLNPA